MKIFTSLVIFFLVLTASASYTDRQSTVSGGSSATSTVSGMVSISNFPATQNVSAVTLPLPSGASTEATLSAMKTIQTDGTQKTLITDGAGTVNTRLLANQIASSDTGLITHSIIHGLTTAGSGTYQDVKVNPSGALTVEATTDQLPLTLGFQEATGSTSVVMSNGTLVTGSTQSAVNTDLLTGTVSGWYDARAFRALSLTIIGSAGISAGAIIVEQTNDATLASSGVSMPMFESFLVSTTPQFTNGSGMTVSASTTRNFEGSLAFRYVRVRISTGFVGGTVQAIALFSQQALTSPRSTVTQSSATALNATVTGSVGTSPGTMNTDISSGAIGVTTTSATITPTGGSANQFNLAVTATSGSPTLDVSIEESGDNGTNWYPVYQFERITTTGTYRTPPMRQVGNKIRYVQTLGGTGTPTITRSLNRVQVSGSSEIIKRFVDRTISITTLNSTTPTYYSEGTSAYQTIFTVGDILTTAPQIKLQGSENGTSGWYDISTPLTAVASSSVSQVTLDKPSKYVRGIISTAGVDATPDNVTIRMFR